MAEVTRKLKIYGTDITAEENVASDMLAAGITLQSVVQVRQNRSSDEVINWQCAADDVVNLEFANGEEWIGAAGDIEDIFSKGQKRGAFDDDEFTMPPSISRVTSRGGSELFYPIIRHFAVDIAGKAAATIARLFDERRCPVEGVFFVNAQGKKTNKEIPAASDNRYLLFIHGVISSHQGAFGTIFKNESALWTTIKTTYGERILTAEQRTLATSPLKNALNILKALPKNATIDIIAHSRGGIVADILARCDAQNINIENGTVGFSEQEINRYTRDYADKKIALGDDDHKVSLGEALEQLTKLAQQKDIAIGRIIRAGTPANGTELLGRKIEVFFNGLLTAIGSAVGDRFNPLYQEVKFFIMHMIKAKADPNLIPGLSCMIVDSPIQLLLNNPQNQVASTLITVEGNAEIGTSIGRSFFVIISNLFFWRANDFAVNTNSMRAGVLRLNPTRYLVADAHHLQYFSKKVTADAIDAAVSWDGVSELKPFKSTEVLTSADRGGLTRSLDFFPVKSDPISGRKPIVLLIPGNMASLLFKNGDRIWVNLISLIGGKLASYDMDDDMQTPSIFGTFYRKLIQTLQSSDFDVDILSYDWRQAVETNEHKLIERLQYLQRTYQVDVHIVAHSMGGLIVRQAMIKNSQTWQDFMADKKSRLVLMGVPWSGSYTTVHALLGRGKALAKVIGYNMNYTRAEFMNAIHTFEGTHCLLPVDDKNIGDINGYWKQFKDPSIGDQVYLPHADELEKFEDYKKAMQAHTLRDGFDKIFYVAGTAERTIDDINVTKGLRFTRLSVKYIKEGDGTVSWRLGIPSELPKSQVYYTSADHMRMTQDADTSLAVCDLLINGVTTKIEQEVRFINRRYNAKRDASSTTMQPVNPLSVLEQIMGVPEVVSASTQASDPLRIKVTHGDLCYARSPVMVGHFRTDALVSAEAALDRALEGILRDRLELSNYPHKIGQSLVIYNGQQLTPGCIIIGLGEDNDLSEGLMSRSVQKGIINYALHMRDNFPNSPIRTDKITSLFIGSGYGQLKIESSIRAILRGVTDANAKLQTLDNAPTLIREIEFMELYKHLTQQAIYALNRIQMGNSKMNLIIDHEIGSNIGGLERLEYNDKNDWWHQFTTQIEIDELSVSKKYKLSFLSASGIARVSDQDVFGSKLLIDELLDRMTRRLKNNIKTSNTIFQLLIPNKFKDIMRSQKNILWKMDRESAQYPWELYYDEDYDEEPTFINVGLVRQLIEASPEDYATVIKSNSALVIADPTYTNYDPLPQAQVEGERLHKLLKKENYSSKLLLHSKLEDIMDALFNDEFKILHIAGHGIYDPDGKGIGIVVEDFVIQTFQIKQLPKIPEFVFINCCHLGNVDPKHENLYRDRYKLAANIGTELIRIGVRAVVITGWAVADAAAEVFADTLYTNLFNGMQFGDAVTAARRACYYHDRTSATWAAYQCYGNPWYKLQRKSSTESTNRPFYSEEEALIALSNLIASTRSLAKSQITTIEEKLEKINQRIAISSIRDSAKILERTAELEVAMGHIDRPLAKYVKLMNHESADYQASAIEQVSALESRMLFKKYYKNVAEDFFINNKETTLLKTILQEEQKVAAKFENLLSSGRNSRRLALYGGAYKRLCSIRIPQEYIKEFLYKMHNLYEASYNVVADLDVLDYAYALTHMMTAQHFMYADDMKQAKIERINIDQLVIELEKQIKPLETNFNYFYDEMRIINLLTIKLLRCRSAECEALKDDIIRMYRQKWQKGGNLANLYSELVHFMFLQRMLEYRDGLNSVARSNAIQTIINALIGLKDG